MQVWIYDIEVAPNLFTVSFICRGVGIKTFTIYDYYKLNQVNELVAFLKQKTIAGFNSMFYDDIILNYIINRHESFNKMKIKEVLDNIFKMSCITIKKYKSQQEHEFVSKIKHLEYFKSIDLMRVGNIQKSLKLVGVSLKHNKLQDLPYKYDAHITPEMYHNIRSYNYNDILITQKLYDALEKEIKLREVFGKKYNMWFLKETDSGIANRLLIKLYSEKSGIPEYKLKDLGTDREYIHMKDAIFDNVSFKTEYFNKFLTYLKKQSFSSNNLKNEIQSIPPVVFAKKKYKFGVGGIHSVDSGNVFVCDDVYDYIDADVASYYPYILINNNVYPEHLSELFVELLKELTEQRIERKKLAHLDLQAQVDADGLKIVINSIFGKLGAMSGFIRDKLAFIKTTINGQLFLLMLIERLELAGFEVISANTDGVVSKVEKTRRAEYDKICEKWSKELDFTLEYTEYLKYVRTDVNNYLTITKSGKIKTKGRFSSKIDLKKGYRCPIVAKAIQDRYLNNGDYAKFIDSNNDVFDYSIAVKVGEDFTNVYDGNIIQDSIRYIVSEKGKDLSKYKYINEANKKIAFEAGWACEIVNDIKTNSSFLINKLYYKREVRKMILSIEHDLETRNLTLF